MATNNFKPFSIASGANVLSQADYEALAALATGFTAGKASSAQINKALRQSSVLANILAQFIADNSGNDVLDDGNPATISANLLLALKANGAGNFLQKTNNLSEIAAAGSAAVTQTLANLGLGGLGVGSAVPVGIPLPWPAATAPTGWMKCNGSSFSLTTYPVLALVYPTGLLPDLRGEFIRGFDDGRGVDISRILLAWQDGTWIQPNIDTSATGTAISIGNGELLFNTGSTGAVSNITGYSGNGSRQRSYIRPRNVAFNYIVRAA